MYTLSNTELTVAILDPIANMPRLGSRYCTGGYIWQVTDAQHGDLMAGPEYPAEPNTFDGQGIPDMFTRAAGADNVPVGTDVMCIGVGLVKRTSPVEPFDPRHNRQVSEFVRWDVSADRDSVTMRTQHAYHERAYQLERTVSLEGRTVRSVTSIRSTGTETLPVRWFSHPFFPNPPDGVLCQFSVPVSMSENPGYALNPEAFVLRKADHDWKRGWYQPMEYEKKAGSLEVIQKHPLVGKVITRTDFMPDFLPIWGNDHTFSFEPYFIRDLSSDETAAWQITFTF